MGLIIGFKQVYVQTIIFFWNTHFNIIRKGPSTTENKHVPDELRYWWLLNSTSVIYCYISNKGRIIFIPALLLSLAASIFYLAPNANIWKSNANKWSICEFFNQTIPTRCIPDINTSQYLPITLQLISTRFVLQNIGFLVNKRCETSGKISSNKQYTNLETNLYDSHALYLGR